MMKETGRIVAIETDCLWVETIRQTTCNNCSAQKGCGHGILGKIGSGKSHYVRVLLGDAPAAQFSVNDDIDIAIPESSLVAGAMIVYLVPILTMLAAAIAISRWLPGDFWVFSGSVAGFLVGLGVVRLHAIVNRNNMNYQPVVLAGREVSYDETLSVVEIR
ncbi:MAG: SoxR reducing system RseC family protein [Oceanicoccus sp.]